MSDAPEKTAQPGPTETARAGAWSQSRMILRSTFAPPAGRRIIVLMTVLIAAILATTYGQLALNEWNQPFYDAITRRDLHDFLYQLGVYFLIVGVLLVLDVLQRWLNETAKFRMRESLDPRSFEALDVATSRVLARDRRQPDGREPRSANGRRRHEGD